MVLAKAKVASRNTIRTLAASDEQRQQCTGTCKDPDACPNGINTIIAKLMAVVFLVALDATADPAVANHDHFLACDVGAYYLTAARGDNLP